MLTLQALQVIANTHANLLVRQRAWRVLRMRYGMQKPYRERRDPVWLSAIGM